MESRTTAALQLFEAAARTVETNDQTLLDDSIEQFSASAAASPRPAGVEVQPMFVLLSYLFDCLTHDARVALVEAYAELFDAVPPRERGARMPFEFT